MKRDRMHAAATLFGMRVLPDNRFLGRLRERRWRRMLVVLVTLSWLLSVAAMTRPVRAESGALWILGAALTLVTLVALALATRNVGSSIDAFADERDRLVRDRAHRIAYWFIGVPIGLFSGGILGFVSRLVDDGEPVLLTASHLWALSAIVYSLLVLFAALPSAIIAWTEPDPPADHFDELPAEAPARHSSFS